MATKTTKAFNSLSTISMMVFNGIIKVSDIYEGYVNNANTDEGGVSSMNGRLNIRPKYQRAYVADTQTNWRENLINSIICGFPINRIYIGVNKDNEESFDNAKLEMLDGQQRTITICEFLKGNFPINIDGNPYFWCNLDEEMKSKILNYSLDVTYCKGDENARIAWFKRINQPNSILTPQELRNATYLGPWLESAKKFFGATSAHARKQINDKDDKYCITKYTTTKNIERGDFLEVAIDWASYIAYPDMRGKRDVDERICRYMAEHQFDDNANELIDAYKTVIDWIINTYWVDCSGYPSSQSFKNVDWVNLYCKYGDVTRSFTERKHITDRCAELVNNYKAFSKTDGVYEWVIRGEKDDEVAEYLYLRGFSTRDLDNMYMAQGGIDPIDGIKYAKEDMHAHHIKSWRDNGVSDYENLVWLSKENHRKLHAGDFGLSPTELRRKRDEVRANNGSL